MYLSGFSVEKKYLFRELSIYAAKADDEFLDKEKMIIDAHCAEMRIDNNNYENDIPYEEVLSKISTLFSAQELRMVSLEILAVLLADDVISDEEQLFIEDISAQFGMSIHETENAKKALLTLKQAYSMMADCVSGK